MGILQKLGSEFGTDKATKHHFCDFYETNLIKNVKVLWEIGVDQGASLKMWANYFKNANVIGFDIEDKSKIKLPNNTSVKYLDQSNIEQLVNLSNNKNIDIIIDDGSHCCDHQIMTFETLFNSLRSGGQYIIEDLHTSSYRFSQNFYDSHFDGKGALQYLNDLSIGNVPMGYKGQVNTISVMQQIKTIQIMSNLNAGPEGSVTAIITHI